MSFRGLVYWFSKSLSKQAQFDWRRIAYWANEFKKQQEQSK